ncbi:Pre-mRNA-splicing factor cwf19 [Vermiconidia calcicola]|uniref:Pre-mRNA-splicing factor cwf19 n=1 Tax=Vermiconidia calcicola TaxID=1690605 RepID=A0ACC3MRN1_9PEZI|nr:Pre-mRNA-splicing factor cwf19 [Vermiconidia calcicola]
MGLSDFGKELVEERTREERPRKHRNRDEDGERKHKHRHYHRSHHKDDSRDREEERRHRHKRQRDGNDDGERRHRKRRRSDVSPDPPTKKAEEVKVFDSDPEEDDDEWVEKEASTAPPAGDILDQRDANLRDEKAPRDAWMQEPSALDMEYVQSKKRAAPPSQFVGAKESHEFKVHEADVGKHLRDLEQDFADSDYEGGQREDVVKDEPAQHEVSYTFWDAGSSWRMTKLKAVYRQAEESGKSVDDVALERYGDIRDFDDAREEEREVDRRKMYGMEYVGLEKPSGELFQERKMKAGIRRDAQNERPDEEELPQGKAVPSDTAAPSTTVPLDSTALNKLKAQLMKAKLRNAPNASQLEGDYQLAEQASLANSKQPDVVVLNNAENRQLASGRSGEVTALSGKRARERGTVQENEDMSIDDMVRQEKRSARGAAGGGSGKELAERIAKDAKFSNDLEYMDDNATKLSTRVVKSDSQLRNVAIEDFQKMQRTLDTCPLCHHEDRSGADALPTAPIVSLATRTYLTLPTEPEIAKGGAVIVPVQHRFNLLECDDDEWEEMRNFMKTLTRYYDSLDKGVIFYENAAHTSSRKGHAALNVVPLPRHLAETASAHFKEAILEKAEQWSQHKPIIDTLALSQKPGYGKQAFRKALVKEMPYFHVFYSLDGGMGHVIEDDRKWPKGDLFAREVIGGMSDKGPDVVKRQGRWERGDVRRVEGFRKKWAQWDWTKVLMDAQ